MSKEYKAIVKWSGNHYHSGQEVTGSRVKQEKDGTVYLFDDEEKFFPNLGEVPPRNKWVQVEHQSVKQKVNGEWQDKDFRRIDEEPNPDKRENIMSTNMITIQTTTTNTEKISINRNGIRKVTCTDIGTLAIIEIVYKDGYTESLSLENNELKDKAWEQLTEW